MHAYIRTYTHIHTCIHTYIQHTQTHSKQHYLHQVTKAHTNLRGSSTFYTRVFSAQLHYRIVQIQLVYLSFRDRNNSHQNNTKLQNQLRKICRWKRKECNDEKSKTRNKFPPSFQVYISQSNPRTLPKAERRNSRFVPHLFSKLLLYAWGFCTIKSTLENLHLTINNEICIF